MPKIVRRHLDGLLISSRAARFHALAALKKAKIGDGVYLSSWSGTELFYKTRTGLRVSTLAEWERYRRDEQKRYHQSLTKP